MAHLMFNNSEIAERANLLYEQQIRTRVEAQNKGRFLVLDVETGDYEIDDDHLKASDRAAAKRPNARLFAFRIGYPAVGRIGRRTTSSKQSL